MRFPSVSESTSDTWPAGVVVTKSSLSDAAYANTQEVSFHEICKALATHTGCRRLFAYGIYAARPRSGWRHGPGRGSRLGRCGSWKHEQQFRLDAWHDHQPDPHQEYGARGKDPEADGNARAAGLHRIQEPRSVCGRRSRE